MARSRKNKVSEEARYILTEESSFMMQEDYRTLRSNIIFSFADHGSKVIAVTSPSRNEGKSTNAVNLAISFSELGRKVILVDCDLRLPTVAAKLSIPEEKAKTGLTDALVGEAALNDVVIRDREHGICELTAGTLPPDPTKLLQSGRMTAVIGALRKSFDYIILDCPPVTEVIDAALLATNVDGYVIVIKHGETHHKDISRALYQLGQADAKILGFLYVNVPSENKKYYRKGHYGHYGYYRRHDNETQTAGEARIETEPKMVTEWNIVES